MMYIHELLNDLEPSQVGKEMYRFIVELYPFCRSITGDGVRETLRKVGGHIPLDIHEVATGTQVFDWTIPKEWNIKDAYIMNSRGDRVVDFRQSNLHVVGYSMPVRAKMSLEDLKNHIYTHPDHPDWIPYRTSYYQERWGFCLSQNQWSGLKDEEHEVCIDSTLEPGHMTYGEYVIEGKTTDEVLLSCHVCHPSLCNDNLSGVALLAFLAKHLRPLSLRYTYRFLFIPGTIGSIAWLCLNEEITSRIKNGLVAACLGDSGISTYKKSRRGNAEIDQAVTHVLKTSGKEFQIIDFFPYGYDERQYCSPGFNLPVGCLMRTPHGEYPEYHTSGDNIELVKPEFLSDSFSKYLMVLNILENNRKYLNKLPKCERQLGKRGLYKTVGGNRERGPNQFAMLWVLNMSDGSNTLLDIAERSGLEFDLLREAVETLREKDLLLEKQGDEDIGI
jgi:aminopeptidase-like protein